MFSSFCSAAAVLRLSRSRSELDPDAARAPGSLDVFFVRLDEIERDLSERGAEDDRRRRRVSDAERFPPPPFVVVIEGLDGSGKSTLAGTLERTISGAVATGTPTASLRDVRPVFDKIGEDVARAFYMVSNYFLQHEMRTAEEEEGERLHPKVYIVDRWFSSTCAYSIGWNTTGGPETIEGLDDSIFCWPEDLEPPDMMLLLVAGHDIRRSRIASRAFACATTAADHNPWDGRLSADEDLGQRIIACHRRTIGPRFLRELDSDVSAEELAVEARRIVEGCLARKCLLSYRSLPWPYKHDPMNLFVHISADAGLCEEKRGRRLQGASWELQLALDSGSGYSPPSSLVIHRADRSGILFLPPGYPSGWCGDNVNTASMRAVIGDYPSRKKWRAEGFIISVSAEEFSLFGDEDPKILSAQIKAYSSAEGISNDRFSNDRVTALCFIPLRIEIIFESANFPRKSLLYEWQRDRAKIEGWTEARSDVSFKNIPCEVCNSLLPVTLAIYGTHCSGKRTLGELTAGIMGWHFHPELGDILRNTDALVDGGHRFGDGSGFLEYNSDDINTWDKRIFKEESIRDDAMSAEPSSSSRVVETWHIGNLQWARIRCNGKEISEFSVAVRKAIANETARSCVLVVHLEISAKTCVRRRRTDPKNSKRLPMQPSDEINECGRLCSFFSGACYKKESTKFGDLWEEHNIPVLVLNNDLDGKDAFQSSLQKIVRFIQENQWRRYISIGSS